MKGQCGHLHELLHMNRVDEAGIGVLWWKHNMIPTKGGIHHPPHKHTDIHQPTHLTHTHTHSSTNPPTYLTHTYCLPFPQLPTHLLFGVIGGGGCKGLVRMPGDLLVGHTNKVEVFTNRSSQFSHYRFNIQQRLCGGLKSAMAGYGQ